MIWDSTFQAPATPKKKAKKDKQYKCVVCKKLYQRWSMTQVVCSPVCGLEYCRKKREKEERREFKLRVEALKPKAHWLRVAQLEFNGFIRERDKDFPCISCGRNNPNTKWNAGHYLSVGAHPALRFDEDNVHKQCEHCNSYLSGNIAAYRPNLLVKIGPERVARLEGPHEPKKYTIADAKEIRDLYRRKLKELKKAAE